MKKGYKRLFTISALAIGVSTFSYLQNNLLSVSKIVITSSKISSQFKGFLIDQKLQSYS